MGVTKFTFKLPVKTKIKVVSNRSYHCYGNLLYHKYKNNKFTNDSKGSFLIPWL